MKKCSKCGVIKEYNRFSKDNCKKDGFTSQCLDCRKDNNLRWKQNNPEYKQPKLDARQKLRKNKSRQELRNNNPLFRLGEDIRKQTTRKLMQISKWKKLRVHKWIGLNTLELRQFIESQFDANMTWENRATYWEIDHITPLSSACTEQELIQLAHYTNIRPILKQENRKKEKKFTKACETYTMKVRRELKKGVKHGIRLR